MATQKTALEMTLSKCYRALQLILDKKTLAIPQNYDVWYNYVAGDNAALVGDMDDHLARAGTVTQDDLDRFYLAHLCPVGKIKASEEIGTRIRGEVDGMAGRLADATSKTREYRDSLNDVSDLLTDSIEAAALKHLVGNMIRSTSEMVRHSEGLEASLAATRAQVMLLNDALAAMQAETITDSLTGLANRKRFDRDLVASMKTALANGTDLCLLLSDVDHFKKFNDLHGHQTGDGVLQEVGRVLAANVAEGHLVARYGGEEFGVILPGTNLQDAVAVANRIRAALASTSVAGRAGGAKLGRITMSFGVALLSSTDTLETFVERADAGLYLAKKAGRDRVRTEVDAQAVRRMSVA